MLAQIACVLALLGTMGEVALGDPGRDEMMRVGLFYGRTPPQSVLISGRGAGRGELSHGTFDGEMQVAADNRGVVLKHKGRTVAVGQWVELWPTGENPWLVMDGAAYRGKLRFERQGDGRLRVINVVEVEDYVRGVVPNEMFADAEAFRVQAVISRTLALYIRDVEKKHRRDGFDICTTGHCQVYRGVDSERPLSDEAVAATRGQILTYRGRPIFSAYHANAGGLTQPVDEAWPGSVRENFPYLCQVESPYDDAAQGLNGYTWCYRWRREIAPEEIGERLRARGRDVGEVRDLTVIGRTRTGRVREIEIVGSRGSHRVQTPAEVRAVLGIPSARFEIARREKCFEVSGWGRGHGVGLSQHGALGMAKAGYGYEAILGHFYRGVALGQDYGRGPSRPLGAPELNRANPETAPVVVPPGLS